MTLTYANRRVTPFHIQLLIQLAGLSPSISCTIDVVPVLTEHITWGIEVLSTGSDYKGMILSHQFHTLLWRTAGRITRPCVIRLTCSHDWSCEIVACLTSVVTALIRDLLSSAHDSSIDRIKQYRTRISCRVNSILQLNCIMLYSGSPTKTNTIVAEMVPQIML